MIFLLGAFILYFVDRLTGISRNDNEAAYYLGWKKPIYYDSDFLLGTPPDVDQATIVTQMKDMNHLKPY